MRTRRRNSPDIGIANNPDERAAIREALGHIQADQLIKSDDIVVITPNWVQQQTPNTGVVVGHESMREVIHFAKKNHPRRIVIAVGSGEKDTSEIMYGTGFDKIIESEDVEFVDLNKGPFTRIDLPHDSPAATNIHQLYNEMTFLISFTQLKLHQEAALSAAIKNIALSWPPAEEHGHPKMNKGIHENLHGFIRAISQKITIDLSIVSASPAMIGTGPSGGLPIHTGLVLCGTDPVAVDTIGARLLGFKPQAIYYLYDCIRQGLGIGNIDEINVRGLPLSEAEKIFSLAAYGQPVALDSQGTRQR